MAHSLQNRRCHRMYLRCGTYRQIQWFGLLLRRTTNDSSICLLPIHSSRMQRLYTESYYCPCCASTTAVCVPSESVYSLQDLDNVLGRSIASESAPVSTPLSRWYHLETTQWGFNGLTFLLRWSNTSSYISRNLLTNLFCFGLSF